MSKLDAPRRDAQQFIKASKRSVARDDIGGASKHLNAAIRSPLSQAGLASIIIVTGAAAQDANTSAPAASSTSAPAVERTLPPKPAATTSSSGEVTALPTIEVRSRKRKVARPTPSAPAPVAPPVQETPVVGAAQSSDFQTSSSGLNRVPTALRNTPQTVYVVPQVVMQQQAVSDVKDALKNVAGITFRAGEGGNQGDTPYIRGFSAQNDIFRDGIRDPGWYTRDAFAVDAVEVYKGPSSVLFGRGSTGGAINLVSKTPQDRNFTEATITANTGPGIRTTIDTNRKVNDEVSTRLVLMGQLYDIPDRDHVQTNRWGVAPSIKVKVNSDTTDTVSYIYQHDKNRPDYGVPFMNLSLGNPRPIAPVDRSTWYGILGPNPDVEKLDAHIITNKLEHDFNNNLKVVNTTRYNYVDHFQLNVFPEQSGVGQPTSLTAPWTPNRNQVAATNTLFTNATDFTARFNTGAWEHTMVYGAEYNRETRDFLRNTYGSLTPTSLLAPDPYRFGGIIQPTAPTGQTFGVSNDIAGYIADQIKLNRYFELLGSGRYEQFRFEQNAPLEAGVNPSLVNINSVDNLFSWRVGGVFHPTPNSSLYVMHGTSFNPSADNMSISLSSVSNALSLAQLAPEKNVTTEGGVKVGVLDDKLTLAGAVFHTEKTNLRVPDPSNSTVTVLNGLVAADGWEASATGYITKEWQVIASYTYVHARITKTTIPAQLNTEPVNTPTNSFSLWSTYDVTSKFQVGFGAFYGGEVYGDVANTALVPDWWRFDAMAAYKISKNATLQLNIYNLTDKFYYASAYTNWAVPAPGRSAALTLRMTW